MAKAKPQLDEQMQEVIRMIRLHNRNGSTGVLREEVAEGLDITVWKARKLITQAETILAGTPRVGIDPSDPLFRSEVARRIKKATTIAKIAETMHSTEEEVASVVDDLEERGYSIRRHGSTVQIDQTPKIGGESIILTNHFHGKPMQFGVISDMHMCNKHSRLDILEVAYEEFARRGIKTVLCPGNYTDGEFRFNKHELLAHGVADQALYCIDHWPQKEGITTYYIDGCCHEGWWHMREGIEFGRYLMLEAQNHGRNDLKYLGHLEADILLQAPGGDCSIKMMHPGGGSAYALSYPSQKIIESLQGGTKPGVLLCGHYHKFDYCYPRNTHVLQCATTCDQTSFMRKNKLEAHLGFIICTLQQDINGGITRFMPEFFPFFDKKYYQTRDDLQSQMIVHD